MPAGPPDTVFVLGAGASLAEAQARRPVQAREHPPLDANFFARVAAYRPDVYLDANGRSLWRSVEARARAMGEPDLGRTARSVSLEGHLGRLYFNVQHNPLASGVKDYFTLVDLYAREVIGTTEWMVGHRAATRDNELLRRMLQSELLAGARVAIVTFNIDLLIEHTLEVLSHSRPGAMWSIANAYGFSSPPRLLSGPAEDFADDDIEPDIPLYKMHGSVNWVFPTRDYYPGADLMGKPRQLWQLTDKHLGTQRLQYRKGKGAEGLYVSADAHWTLARDDQRACPFGLLRLLLSGMRSSASSAREDRHRYSDAVVWEVTRPSSDPAGSPVLS